MKHTQKESSLNTTDQHNNNSSNSELLEQKEIPETPFKAVRMEDKWFLTLGKYRLTEPMQTFEQISDDAHRADWTRIMQIINIMILEHEAERMKPKHISQQDMNNLENLHTK